MERDTHTHTYAHMYIHVHTIHTGAIMYMPLTVTCPVDRETEKAMGTGRRAAFIKALLVKLISGGSLLSPHKAENYSHRVNSITACSLMANTELLESL